MKFKKIETVTSVKKIMLIKSIKIALKKLAPVSIPLDRKRAIGNDFYHVWLEFTDTDEEFLVKKLSDKELTGTLWKKEMNKTGGKVHSLPVSSIEPKKPNYLSNIITK